MGEIKKTLTQSNPMIRYLPLVILFYSCSGNIATDTPAQPDSLITGDKPFVNYDWLKEYLLSADSVVLLSHHSPNEPIKNPSTGKYYSHSIPFIENGKINYPLSVQERKQIDKNAVKELVDILSLPAVDDSLRTACFQPRNAVVAFNNGGMSAFDFCFECRGYDEYGYFVSYLIMNTDKYNKLYAFYKKHGFKYYMDE